jgi:hypothetical protein
LKTRYEALRERHRLVPMLSTAWRFFRLRPGGFPHRRILQAAAYAVPGGLLNRAPVPGLKEAARSRDPLAALRSLARVRPIEAAVEVPRSPDDASIPSGMSPATVDRVVINAFVPLLAETARFDNDRPLETILLELLLRLPPENDAVTRRFADLGEAPLHALMSQGQHELYQTHCKASRCLHCAIGQHILQQPG